MKIDKIESLMLELNETVNKNDKYKSVKLCNKVLNLFPKLNKRDQEVLVRGNFINNVKTIKEKMSK